MPPPPRSARSPSPACGRRSGRGHARLSALTLAALATGYHPDGSAPEPGFPKTDFASVLPAWPSCLRLSTLRADRSFCRPTGDPEPPGSGLAIPRAGTAPRFRLSGLPFRKGALHERGGVCNRNGDGCQGIVLGRATRSKLAPRARSPAIVTKRRQQVARIERSETRRGISGPKCRSRVSLRSTRATVVRELLGWVPSAGSSALPSPRPLPRARVAASAPRQAEIKFGEAGGQVFQAPHRHVLAAAEHGGAGAGAGGIERDAEDVDAA